MTEQRKERLKTMLINSRQRLTEILGEFAVPLYQMYFVAQDKLWRISTNGYCTFFNPDWLQKLTDTALDFILAHQLMHIHLGHTKRPEYYKGDRFHLACDIVANSRLLLFGIEYEKLPGIGTIYTRTFYPREEGLDLTSREAFDCIPFDPSTMSPGKRRSFMIDSEAYWDRKDDRGKSGTVIMSPDNKLPEIPEHRMGSGYRRVVIEKEEFDPPPGIDYIDSDADNGRSLEPFSVKAGLQLNENVRSKIESLRSEKSNDGRASIDAGFTERIWENRYDRKLSWRKLLNTFIQKETYDYTFTPPDRRFSDSDFFLPDYNTCEEKKAQVLFMVDTSGSIDDRILSAVYSELCGALIQFGGTLTGYLSFFDTKVYTPVSFSDIDSLSRIRPRGGGGTDYNCVFDFIKTMAQNDTLSDIVIITDGHASFPHKSAALNYPVLWLLTDVTRVAPFGRCGWINTKHLL